MNKQTKQRRQQLERVHNIVQSLFDQIFQTVARSNHSFVWTFGIFVSFSLLAARKSVNHLVELAFSFSGQGAEALSVNVLWKTSTFDKASMAGSRPFVLSICKFLSSQLTQLFSTAFSQNWLLLFYQSLNICFDISWLFETARRISTALWTGCQGGGKRARCIFPDIRHDHRSGKLLPRTIALGPLRTRWAGHWISWATEALFCSLLESWTAHAKYCTRGGFIYHMKHNLLHIGLAVPFTGDLAGASRALLLIFWRWYARHGSWTWLLEPLCATGQVNRSETLKTEGSTKGVRWE